jgi:hypothetical protein
MNPIDPISDKLAKSMGRLFELGGFALAFGFAGLVLIMVANVSTGSLKLPMFVVGCLLTFICLFYFLFISLQARRATKSLKEDLPLLDALQRAALQVSELASVTQSFAFKHLAKVQKAIETISPMIESLPVIGPAAKKVGLTDSAKVSAVIVAATQGTKDVVFRLQEAIRTGDLKGIQKYGKQLDSALADLKVALKGDEAAQAVAEADSTHRVGVKQHR